MDEQQAHVAVSPQVQMLKRNGLGALLVFMLLLVVVIVQTAAGRIPPFWTLITLAVGIYAIRALWKARQLEKG